MHCAAGRSRSAAVVCAYLMHREGLDCEDAIRDLCETHWICPNVGFKEQLQLFEDLAGDIARWPSPADPAWPKKVGGPALHPVPLRPSSGDAGWPGWPAQSTRRHHLH